MPTKQKPKEYYFDPVNLSLEIDGENQALTPIVSRLLDYFLASPGTVISRQTLATNIWQSEHVSNDAINRCISLLRKTLGSQANGFVKTIKQRGYSFNVPDDVVFHRVVNQSNIVHFEATNTIDSPIRRLKRSVILVTTLVTVLVIVLLFGFLLSGFEGNSGTSLSGDGSGAQDTVISLQVTPTKTSAGAHHLSAGLTDQLLVALSKSHQFTLTTSANTQLASDFTVETTLHGPEQDERLVVRLINNKSQRILFSTAVGLSQTQKDKVIEQITAAIRTVLLHGNNSQYYLNEFPKLSFIDIETLSEIS